MTEENKKRKAVYNREADKKYRENNKELVRYTTYKSRARVFVRDLIIKEDIGEFEALLSERKKKLSREDEECNGSEEGE